MTGSMGWLERVEADALRTDRYLDALLATSERGGRDAPASLDLAPGLREAAVALQAGATRVHPSFRFEERLARRLAAAAAAAEPRLAAAGGGSVVELARPTGPADAPAQPDPGRGPRPVRPLLVGGAITSAALSIAGAAYVAWRIARAGGPAGTATMPLPTPRDLLRRLD